MEFPDNPNDRELQTAHDYYDQIRKQIEHEDDLITQRLSWLMASQSFLFTAYAIVLNGLQPRYGSVLENARFGFFCFLPFAAIIYAALIYASIWGGLLAMRHLNTQWADRAPKSGSFDRPPVQGSRFATGLGQIAPKLLPVALIAMWIYLLLWNRV